MKIVLIAGVLLVLAGSLVADYKWRRWMASRKRERDALDRRAG
jgi:hypothetical protein